MTGAIRCTGAHCAWRERCAHHALPTTDTKALRWPVRVEDACEDYEPKPQAWGHGRDTEEND